MGLTPETATVYILADPDDAAAGFDAVATSADAAAASIDESFAGAGASASAAAGEIAGSFDASMSETAEAAKVAGASVDESFAAASTGAAAASDEIAASGLAAGAGMREGVAEGTAGMAEDLAGAGLLAGTEMGGAVKDGTADLGDDLAKTGEESGGKLAAGAEKGTSGVKGMLGNLGVPGGLLSGWGGLALGIGAVGGIALDLGEKMQSADTAIATSAGISSAAAKSIGTAFLGTAGTSEFSGKEMATAFSKVAGQLKSTEGQALSTATAVKFQAAATDLATAKQVGLGTATSTLASVMQAFSLKTKDAATASDALFETSNATGQSVTYVGQQVDKIKTKLGGLAPTLTQTSALFVDMADHGESGRAGMSALTGAFTAFLKPAATAAKAQTDLNVATKDLTPTLQAYAIQVKNGTLAGTALSKVTTTMTAKQQASWSAFTSANTAVNNSAQALQKMGITAVTATGKLKPLGTIIGQLHKQITGMGTAAAVAQLKSDGFGSSSTKLLKIIQAGPASFSKATTAVSKLGTAHTAAGQQAGTLHGQLETIKSTADDWATDLGQVVIPAVTDLAGGLSDTLHFAGDVLDWFKDASDPALAVGAAVGLILTPAIISWGISTATSAGEAVAGWASSAAAGVTSYASQAASLVGISTSWGTSAGAVAGSAEDMSTSAAGVAAATATAASDIAVSDEAMVASADTAAAGMDAAAETAEVGMAGMMGPIGLVAVGIGGIAAAFSIFGSSGPSAAQQTAAAVTALSKKLGQIPDSNLAQLETKFGDISTDIKKVVAQLDKLTPSSNGAAAAAGKLALLHEQAVTTAGASATMTANIKTLGFTFGLTSSQVQSFAQQAGVNLKQGLDPTKVTAFVTAMKTSTQAFNTSATTSKGWASTVAANAASAVTQTKAQTKLLVTDTQEKMILEKIAMSGGGSVAIAAFANSLKGGVPTVIALNKEIGTEIPSATMAVLKANMSKGGDESMQALAQMIRSGTGPVAATARTMVTTISVDTGKLKTTTAKVGKDSTQALIAAIEAADPTISTAARTVLQHATVAMSKHKTDGKPVGSALAAGIASGLLSQTSAVSAAAATVVQNAVNAAKAKGTIKSPSGLTEREVGLPLAQGVARGLTNNAGLVASAMADVVTGASHVGGSAGIAQAVAAGGTSNSSTIRGGGAAGAGTAGTVNFNLTLNVSAATSDPGGLAAALSPYIRTEFLQLQRSLGGQHANVGSGLGFDS